MRVMLLGTLATRYMREGGGAASVEGCKQQDVRFLNDGVLNDS